MQTAVSPSEHLSPVSFPENSELILRRLVTEASGLDLFQRLALARKEIPGRIVFTTSFGLEDQAVAHALFAQDIDIEVVTLDTGRLFPQTYDVWTQTEQA